MARCTYCKYFLVGAAVGVAAIIAREIIAYLMPADTPVYYLISVVLVYAGGIIASFHGHYRVTFSHIRNKRAALKSIGRFTIIAIIGMLITTLLSYQIRYATGMEPILGKLLPAFAFATGTVIASVATFLLNARYTFVENPKTHD